MRSGIIAWRGVVVGAILADSLLCIVDVVAAPADGLLHAEISVSIAGGSAFLQSSRIAFFNTITERRVYVIDVITIVVVVLCWAGGARGGGCDGRLHRGRCGGGSARL